MATTHGLPLADMLNDAATVERRLREIGSPMTSPIADLCIHVRALVDTVERMEPAARAWEIVRRRGWHVEETSDGRWIVIGRMGGVIAGEGCAVGRQNDPARAICLADEWMTAREDELK